MTFVCPDCGYESDGPGDCPECEVTLLKEEGLLIEDGKGVEDEDPIETW